MERSSQVVLTCLLNASWQIALVAVIASVGARLMHQASPRYRHILWMAALVLSLCLPVLTTLRFPFPGSPSFANQPVEQATIQPMAIDPIQVPTATFIPVTQMHSAFSIGRNAALCLVAIYLLFLCYRGIAFVRACRMVRSIVRDASETELPGHIHDVVERCKSKLELDRVRVMWSSAVPAPITLGFWNPLVILPERLLLETDRDLLTSAVGHELVHVRRRDYAFNLIHELIYLPLSFHPAAALVRRRIRQTRELSCDELVADKLLEAEVYARALVRLAGSAMTKGRREAITVGISDADILEERVMRMLIRPTINARAKSLLLIASLLLLSLPCFAAIPFALQINIDAQQSVEPPAAQDRAQKERTRSEFVMPPIEAGSEGRTLAAWLKKPGDRVERGDIIARIKTSKGVVDIPVLSSGIIERLVVPVGEVAASGDVLAVILPQDGRGQSAEERRAEQAQRELLTLLKAQQDKERQLHAAAGTTEDAERQAKLRAEQALLESALVEKALVDRGQQLERSRADAATLIRSQLEAEIRRQEDRGWSIQSEGGPAIVAQRRVERELVAREQAELAKQASIGMQQAIQIANSRYPGIVLESRLVREGKQPCYLLRIISENGAETVTTRILLSATDGTVLHASKEEH